MLSKIVNTILPSLLCLLIVLISFTRANSQGSSRSRITPGDKIPIELMDFIQQQSYRLDAPKIDSIKLNSKVVILDYWFTGCVPCIESWPKLLKMQEKFADNIQIILVNHIEERTVVDKFVKQWATKRDVEFDLPIIAKDTLIYKLIPPSGYPTVIWIDKENRFRASTGSAEFTEENVNAFILNDEISLRQLSIQINDFDPSLPLYVNENGGDSKQMLYYSTFSKHSSKVYGTQYYESSSDSTGYYITATNWSISELIRYAFNDDGPYLQARVNQFPRLAKNQLVFIGENVDRFFDKIENGEIQTDNRYTYQQISNRRKSVLQLRKTMQNDIRDFFGLEINWQEKIKECLVLKASDTTLISDFQDGETQWLNYPNNEFILTNASVSYFLSSLSNGKAFFNSPYPFVDETSFKGKLDLSLSAPGFSTWDDLLADLSSLNLALKKYKMSLTIEKRKVNILVISDLTDKYLFQ